MLEIVKYGDEVLASKSKNVTVFDSALTLFVDAMFDTLDEANGVGLAAPQVGVSKRIFIVDTRQEGERLAFINPEIIETSVEMVPYEEGCLSIPGIYYEVMRPKKVTIQAQDIKGKTFTMQADGLFARAIQHEFDHLRGKLFVDCVSKEEKELILKAYEQKNRNKSKAKPRKKK